MLQPLSHQYYTSITQWLTGYTPEIHQSKTNITLVVPQYYGILIYSSDIYHNSTHSYITWPAVLYRCCSGSAVFAGRGGDGRGGHGGGSAGSGTVPLSLCGGGVHSLEAGSVRLATLTGSSVWSPPETEERTGGQTRVRLEGRKGQKCWKRDLDCLAFVWPTAHDCSLCIVIVHACVTYYSTHLL